MGKDNPWYEHREEIRKATTDLAFSERFGWTPKQIRELSDEERWTYTALLSGASLNQKENG